MKIMTLLLIITGLLVGSNAIAQENEINTRYTSNSLFLFNKFETGTAYFKDGSTSKASFNYNVVNNELCYLKNNQILVIENIEELDSVRINNKIFTFINNKIFEMIYKGKINVLLSRNADLSAEKPTGAYGTASNTSAVSKKTSLYTQKSVLGEERVNIQNEEDQEIPVNEKLYLLKDNDLFYASKSKILRKFKSNKSDIKSFIKEKDINEQNKEDLLMLVSFLEEIN